MSAPREPKLTVRDREMMRAMVGLGWRAPIDFGGYNGSHHSATAAKLTRYGLVERRRRRSGIRGSYWYRLSPTGARLLSGGVR